MPELLALHAATRDPAVLQQALIQLHNTKQPLDVGRRKGYAAAGFMPELWIFSVQAYDDPGGNGGPPRDYNRGIGHHLNVPWPTAAAQLGLARACLQQGGNRLRNLTGQRFCQ